MADRSDNPPDWARRAVQAAPDLPVYQPVGPVLPTWMRVSQQDWILMREAKVPHPGRWVRATDPDALKRLLPARRLLVENVDAHVRKHLPGYGWVASQAELDAACIPLPEAPERHRFILRAGIDEADLKNHACERLLQGAVTLILEQWKAGDLVEAEPVPVCPYLSYWVAQVQTSIGLKLMVLVTDQEFVIHLASPGGVTVWAHGQEETLVLPVAPARLDPGDARLGYVIAFCRHHSLILPAFRPPESKKVRTDAD